MIIRPLPSAPAAAPDGTLHHVLRRWLAGVAAALNIALPPKEVRTFSLTSDEVSAYFDVTGKGTVGTPYFGWALCNGQNGTPDLRDRFIRISATAAGASGGTDSSAHTHSTPAHQHQTDIGWDSGNNLYATAGDPLSGYVDEDIVHHALGGLGAAGFGTARLAKTREDGSGTTGAASATDNRPAFYTLVALMRLEVAV